MTSAVGDTATSVAMGEMAVTKAPGRLVIRGLGSCIALALHDPLQRLAGLAHVVIPRPLPSAPPSPAWAATEAVPRLLEAMETAGGRPGRLVARLAGGSSMFPGPTRGYEVGQANADTVEALLRAYGVPVLSRQVGGHASRNVALHAADGRLDVESSTVRRAPGRPRGRDPTEAARALLEAAVAPLSHLLKRPIAVDAAARHDLGAADVVAFLGVGTRMRWSRLTYADADGRTAELDLTVPDLHARHVDEELRSRIPEFAATEGAAIDEALNIMLSHTLTALAKMRRATLRPRSLESHRGTTRELTATVTRGRRETLRVAHARIHLEGAFHGVDLALFGEDLP